MNLGTPYCSRTTIKHAKPYSVESVSDLIAVLPDNVESHHQHHLMALDGAPTVGSGYRTSPANCDDPVHGSGPGEIVFRHMSGVQRGVRSLLPPPQPETAWVMSHP
jgi:hypothetical protein